MPIDCRPGRVGLAQSTGVRPVVGAGGGLAWGLLSHSAKRVEDDTHLKFQLQEEVG
jgi:hypothetical protein